MIPIEVSRVDLRVEELLGSGGFGSVHGVVAVATAEHIGQYSLVYKAYSKALEGEDAAVLRSLVALGVDLARNGLDLSTFASWPRAVVVTPQGGVSGVLMDRAPGEFWLRPVRDRPVRSAVLAESALLLNTSSYQQSQLGFVPSVDRRLQILAHAAHTLTVFHRNGVVIGDLSPRNLLFSVDPQPRTYLLDCDSVALDGRCAFPRMETPAWSAKSATGQDEPWSAASDVLKFALLVVRMLAGDQLVTDPDDLHDVPDVVRSHAKRSIQPEPELRPSAQSWVTAISDAARSWPRPFTTTLPLRSRRAPRLRLPVERQEHERAYEPAPAESRLRILMLGTEWLPRHGGLSQFNRHLAIALAARGHEIYSCVSARTAPDADDAALHGVQLVVPEVVSGYANLHIRPAELMPDQIDVVVGHDRFTGLAAVTQARRNFPCSVLVQIVHTMPEELEWLKGRAGATARAEARLGELRAMCSEADVICAVGPRLSRFVESMMHDGFSSPSIVRLDPGLEFSSTGRPVGRSPGPEAVCLLLGRTDDPDLKGLDLGAHAFSLLPRGTRTVARLVVRGAPESTGDELHATLTAGFGLARGEVAVRPFDPTPGTVDGDLRRSSVLLMPSRGEGFGLVGLEAIGVGTPVLVSSRSGLAEMLLEHAPEMARRFVVQVDDSPESDPTRWADALADTLEDRDGAFRRTLVLWDALANRVSWSTAAVLFETAALQAEGAR